MFRRQVNISKSSSFFLFGARGTGKSTLLREVLFQPDDALLIDLLLPSEFDRLLRNPESLLDQIRGLPSSVEWVILDEVQKIPPLLDVVHHAIENLKVKFALSGSSARKLKRGGANLLAGRAFVYHLHPLTCLELEEAFDLESQLNFGSLPRIFELPEESDRKEFLTAYTHTYLKEEILAEQVIRSLPPFRKFLEIAAQMNGELLNYSAIAKDVGVDDKTIKNYYTILEDTLVGFLLEPYHKSLRKTQLESPRFYFFDLGVKRAIQGTLDSRITPRTYSWGKAFEHFIIVELHRLNSYLRRNHRFYFLRTQAGVEIDLIIERPGESSLFIEIKSSTEVSDSDVKHLEALAGGLKNTETVLLSLDPNTKRIRNTHCLHWQDGLRELGYLQADQKHTDE